MPQTPFRVYIGWDSREDIAYQVARQSILRHASIPVEVTPIKQDAVRALGLYDKPVDPLASTEFTYTRFLVPALAGYEGWALFIDCDFLFTADIAALVKQINDTYALMCVHHDHRPPETQKMDGCTQTVYPRKNWSSMMLINCAHPDVKKLTPEVVNTQTGAYLHRFEWLQDQDIGAVDATWNWLEGWSPKPDDGSPPNVIHYTRGGPWFDNWQHVDYADLWLAEAGSLMNTAS